MWDTSGACLLLEQHEEESLSPGVRAVERYHFESGVAFMCLVADTYADLAETGATLLGEIERFQQGTGESFARHLDYVRLRLTWWRFEVVSDAPTKLDYLEAFVYDHRRRRVARE
jgi:hypothetical protein